MSNVAYTIPNLIQGVSQQPDAQRDPSQGEIQINGMSSIAEGLRKRDSSRVLAEVSSTSFGDCFIHTILRDASEKYMAVIRANAINVFKLSDGTAQTVNPAANAFDYLVDSGKAASENVANAQKEIRAVSIADYTFVVNTKRTTAMKAALAPETPRPVPNEALVWVKQAAYGNEYRMVVSVTNGTPATPIEVKVETPVAPVVAGGGVTETFRISSEDIARQLRGALKGGPVSSAAGSITMQAGVTTPQNSTTAALDTTTNGAGTGLQVTCTGDGTDLTAVAVVSGQLGSQYLVGDKIYVQRDELDGTGTDETPVHVATVATITGTGQIAELTIEQEGSVLWLQTSVANQTINVEVFDAKSNTTISAIINEVQLFTELPNVAPEGYQVEITGDPGNSFDNYHVEFEPRSGTFAEGSWLETVGPGLQYEVDEDQMPHVLVRLDSGDWYFGPADGSTPTGMLSGDELPKWGDRTAGDDDTAPFPTFIDNKINDVFIYKNRLGFLADESVILSRSRDFFEFFPETVTTVLDTDPIDLVASNNRVSILKYAVPYQDELIIFSEQYQFRFNAADTVLTPATAQITILTQFDVDTGCRPMQAGGGILFAQSNDQWSQFREFSVRGAGTALTADSADVTAYVSSYIPNEVYKMTVNDTGNSAYFISNKNVTGVADYRKRIYVYKWFFRNTGEGTTRAQSSWSYWDFNGQIIQVEAVEETLYVLIQRGTAVYLETVSIMDRMQEEVAAPYPMLLDRLTSTTTATPTAFRMAMGTFDPVTKTTTWTLRHTATATTQLWSGYKMSPSPNVKPGPVLLDEITSGTSFSTKGDWSQTPVWAGEPYAFRYRFTKFKFYQESGGGKAAVNTYRTQIRRAKLRYHESGYFEIVTLPEHRQQGKYIYDGVTIAVRGSWVGQPTTMPNDVMRYYEGVFSFPVIGDGSKIYCEIHNETPHPCKFSTCEWIGNLTDPSRSRR